MEQRRWVEIRYAHLEARSGGADDRAIRITHSRRGWEVDAGVRDALERVRTLLVSGIQTLEPQDETFEILEGNDDVIDANRGEQAIDLVVPQGQRWLVEAYAESIEVLDEDEKSIKIRAQIPPPLEPHIGLLLIAAGLEAFVVRPKDLVGAGRGVARNLLAHHSDSYAGAVRRARELTQVDVISVLGSGYVTVCGAMRHGLRGALGVLLVAIVLTGCVKLDLSMRLQSDETVDGSMIVGFDKTLADMMGSEFDKSLREMERDTPKGAESEPYEDDDYIGTKITFADTPLDEFDDDSMSIEHDGDEFVVDGELDMSESAMGSGDDELGDLGELGDLRNVDSDISVKITFPGEVVDHNGQLDGNTVSWTGELGDQLQIQARAKDSGSGIAPWLWVVIGAVVAAALGGALFAFMRFNRRQAEAASNDELPPPPPPAPAGASADD